MSQLHKLCILWALLITLRRNFRIKVCFVSQYAIFIAFILNEFVFYFYSAIVDLFSLYLYILRCCFTKTKDSKMDIGPISQRVYKPHDSNLVKIYAAFTVKSKDPNRSQFCTSRRLSCHDRCAKLWPDWIRIRTATNIIFVRFELWAHRPFVKWIPDYFTVVKALLCLCYDCCEWCILFCKFIKGNEMYYDFL